MFLTTLDLQTEESMTTTTINAFEHTVHVTNQWLDELGQQLGRTDRQHA